MNIKDCPYCKDPREFYTKKRHKAHVLAFKLRDFNERYADTQLKKVYGQDRWVRQ